MINYHRATQILIQRLVDLGQADTLLEWDKARAKVAAELSESALDSQIGGNHYKDLAIQPVEYILANKLPFCEGNVVKYITRWRSKGGVKDLEKAKHFIDLIIQNEAKNEQTN